MEKLEQGARVAYVGCGYGSSTIIMAQAFLNSMFFGYDFHKLFIEHARREAARVGVNNIRFDVATAKEYPGKDYDLVTFFDWVHDMGDPVGAAAHVRASLVIDRTWMVVEPFVVDDIQENLNPVGRAFYTFSTTVCTPTSLSQEVRIALGAKAGEQRLQETRRARGI